MVDDGILEMDDLAAAVAAELGPKAANRPDISRLPDAVMDGRPLFRAGDKIVIERRATVLQGNPYLDTRTYKVRAVDLDTGLVRLYDESLAQNGYDNWREGLAAGQVYKFAAGNAVSTKRKRGRPRKNPIVAETAAPTEPTVPRRRGRPKGSKNRDKAVITAEKTARKAARAAKRRPGRA